MKCLRCGYCCVYYDVVIVNDPKLGPRCESNLCVKGSGVRCPHLLGDTPGKLRCAIHNKRWYKRTPCASHGQIEVGDIICRLGAYILRTPVMCTHLAGQLRRT